MFVCIRYGSQLNFGLLAAKEQKQIIYEKKRKLNYLYQKRNVIEMNGAQWWNIDRMSWKEIHILNRFIRISLSFFVRQMNGVTMNDNIYVIELEKKIEEKYT